MTHSATGLLTDCSVKSPLQSSGLTSAAINWPGCVSSFPKQRAALRLRPASVEPPPEKLPRASRLVSVGLLPAELAAAAPLQPARIAMVLFLCRNKSSRNDLKINGALCFTCCGRSVPTSPVVTRLQVACIVHSPAQFPP
ncbi:uncharacterized protein LOC125536154 isoform X2 [Triticum urartu]|uniref:uncharacterized protein LOC125536154 isoform X2 n=1 Tax=Triticum urartu TaxID=4572 RepID=UPI002044A7FD|nr:uncharacterized protein LOC125536154 isoform X2 [Triticum urartu]